MGTYGRGADGWAMVLCLMLAWLPFLVFWTLTQMLVWMGY